MNIFWKPSIDAIPRLLGLMDKNPLSQNYGCFHREFWHHRLCDFPSSSRQQGVLALALIWHNPSSSYYKSNEILEYITAAIEFTLGLQKADGSFDEWYPNERGWAGPTGYVTHALARTYELCHEEFPQELKQRLLKVMLSSAKFLSDEWEEHILFNHIAMALLPIFQVYKITNDESLYRSYQDLWKKFKKYWNDEEGWGIEYDGADIGYQSATASFLARIHFQSKDEAIKDLCEKSLEFVSYFCFPDGTFARRLGCRQTETLFHYALVYWSSQGIDIAERMLSWDVKSLEENKQLTINDHEDHYFIYRIIEFLEAGALWNEVGEQTKSATLLPYEENNFRKYFEEAGFLFYKDETQYSVINLKRGGHLVSFLSDGDVIVDSGIFIRTIKDELLTSLEWDSEYNVAVKDRILVSGRLHYWDQPSFTPVKMIIFRLTMLLLGNHRKLAYWLKVLIRKVLLKKGKRSSLHFTREVFLSSRPHVDSQVKDDGQRIREFLSGGNMDIRFVPQSRYFKYTDLKHIPVRRPKGH